MQFKSLFLKEYIIFLNGSLKFNGIIFSRENHRMDKRIENSNLSLKMYPLCQGSKKFYQVHCLSLIFFYFFLYLINMQGVQFFPMTFCYFNQQTGLFQWVCCQTKPNILKEEIEIHQQKVIEQEKQRWGIYLQFFQRELIKNKQKYDKKVWEPFQDKILLQLRNKSQSWVQISKSIQRTNPQICKRRYIRISETQKKWPKQLDNLIKTLYQDKGKNWDQIYNVVRCQSFQGFPKYSLKKIKERYHLYLKTGIDQGQWEIKQDLELLNLVKQKGKKWKELTEIMENRTELQLKNRYNGTLKLIEKRVLRKVNFFMKNQNMKKKAQNLN